MATQNSANVGVTTAGSNTYTYPSATDTLVGRDSIDTLTNKTLSPGSNTMPGGIAALTSNAAATNATTTIVGASWTMPANLAVSGMVIRLKLFYRFVKTTSPPILTCNLNVGVTARASFTITSVSSGTTSGGSLEGSVTILTTGVSGTMMTALVGLNDHGITSAINWCPQAVNIASQTVDTTASNVVSLDMKMNSAVASNTLTISQSYIEIIKL